MQSTFPPKLSISTNPHDLTEKPKIYRIMSSLTKLLQLLIVGNTVNDVIKMN